MSRLVAEAARRAVPQWWPIAGWSRKLPSVTRVVVRTFHTPPAWIWIRTWKGERENKRERQSKVCTYYIACNHKGKVPPTHTHKWHTITKDNNQTLVPKNRRWNKVVNNIKKAQVHTPSHTLYALEHFLFISAMCTCRLDLCSPPFCLFVSLWMSISIQEKKRYRLKMLTGLYTSRIDLPLYGGLQ